MNLSFPCAEFLLGVRTSLQPLSPVRTSRCESLGHVLSECHRQKCHHSQLGAPDFNSPPPPFLFSARVTTVTSSKLVEARKNTVIAMPRTLSPENLFFSGTFGDTEKLEKFTKTVPKLKAFRRSIRAIRSQCSCHKSLAFFLSHILCMLPRL